MTTTHKFPPQDATFDANGVQRGGCAYRNNGNWDCGFSVQFGLPYELGMYRKMGATNDTLRPWGCSAIDIPRQAGAVRGFQKGGARFQMLLCSRKF